MIFSILDSDRHTSNCEQPDEIVKTIVARQLHEADVHRSAALVVSNLKQTRLVAPDHFENLHDILPAVGLSTRHSLVSKVIPLRVNTLRVHLEVLEKHLSHAKVPMVRSEVVR